MKYKIYQPDDRPEWAKDMVRIIGNGIDVYTKGRCCVMTSDTQMIEYTNGIAVFPTEDNKNGKRHHGMSFKKLKGNLLNLCCACREYGFVASHAVEKRTGLTELELETFVRYRKDGYLHLPYDAAAEKRAAQNRRRKYQRQRAAQWFKLAKCGKVESACYPHMSTGKMFILAELTEDYGFAGSREVFETLDDALKWLENPKEFMWTEYDADCWGIAEIDGIVIKTNVSHDDVDILIMSPLFCALEHKIKSDGWSDADYIVCPQMTFAWNYDDNYNVDWDVYVPSLHDFKQAFLKRNCSSDTKVDGEEYKAEKRLSFYTDPDMYQYMSDEDFEYAMDLQFNEAT